jgi:hypothetical protein
VVTIVRAKGSNTLMLIQQAAQWEKPRDRAETAVTAAGRLGAFVSYGIGELLCWRC